MKSHSFAKSVLDTDKCMRCKRGFIAHTPAATCEGCQVVADCEIYEIHDMLLCRKCTEGMNEAADERVKVVVDRGDIIMAAQRIDKSIRFNGDFYNAQTVAIVDIRKAIESNEAIVDKQFEFQKVIAERYEHLKSVIFELDSQKHDAVVEQLIISKTLRDFGDDLRKEFREQLKQNDTQYIPMQPKVVKPKLTKKDPKQKLAEALALMRGCTITEAMILIERGQSTKAAKESE